MILKKEEQVIFGMRELFEKHGYRRFEMSKFEEYDFYAENRSFLSSEKILTYTGLDGKLLALKPDVTLSIVKNTKGSYQSAERLYYNETVYRARKGDKEYREIMQAGAEYIGFVDIYATLEILLLASESLKLIDPSYIMDISHMGFASGLLEEAHLGDGAKRQILNAVREKNAHEIRDFCAAKEVPSWIAERLEKLATAYGDLKGMLPELKEICCNGRMRAAYEELSEISRCLEECGISGRFNLDFSIVNDMDYYNGIIFQGFVKDIPSGVLSGGRYDRLVHKLGKRADAIGFAVYLDQLARMDIKKEEYDTDVLLLYSIGDDPAEVMKKSDEIVKGGEKVLVKRSDSADSRDIRCRRVEYV